MTLEYAPRPFRMAIMSHGGRELAVLTVRDGRLCASYDEDDLDQAARQFLDRVLELNRADLPGDGPLWHEASTFRCASTGCPVQASPVAGYVGPWHQLVDLGWHRNGAGAWECPGPHQVVPYRGQRWVRCGAERGCPSAVTFEPGAEWLAILTAAGWRAGTVYGWMCPGDHSVPVPNFAEIGRGKVVNV